MGSNGGMNPLLARLRAEKAASKGAAIPVSKPISEVDRVVALPIRDDLGADLTPDLKTPHGTATLRPIQSAALKAVKECLGGFFPIGVGHGKSLIALLAGTVLDAKCTIIFVPASTVKTLEKTRDDFSKHFRMPENLHILSYARLSRPEGTAILDKLRGDTPAKDVCIVCDEVHRVKRKEAARTKRLLYWFKENEDARFVGLSGTITSKSIKDFSHLLLLALRSQSPLPLRQTDLDLWAASLDVESYETRQARERAAMNGRNYTQESIEALKPIREWAEKHGFEPPQNEQPNQNVSAFAQSFGVGRVTKGAMTKHTRRCFAHRLRKSPGVVATQDTSANASLYIRKNESVYLTKDIRDAMRDAEENNATPSGEAFETDLAAWRCFRQLSWGYYLEWDWGATGPDYGWLWARKYWNTNLYRELKYRSRPGYDSKLLVIRQIQREIEAGQGRREIHNAWQAWDQERHKKTPPTVAIWIDDDPYIRTLHDIHQGPSHKAIWVDSQEMQDRAKQEGYTVYGAGKEIPDHPHTAVLSIAAHGIGKNLVQWNSAHVLTWQSDGTAIEQLIGRHHRPGQQADEVWFNVYTHTEILKKALTDSYVRSAYIKEITGNDQKLLLATTV